MLWGFKHRSLDLDLQPLHRLVPGAPRGTLSKLWEARGIQTWAREADIWHEASPHYDGRYMGIAPLHT